jgi:hypothetical protein
LVDPPPFTLAIVTDLRGVPFMARPLGPEPAHGTLERYTNRGCRCVECRAVNTQYATDRRRELQYGEGAPMGPAVRERILGRLAAGESVVAAAKAEGISRQAVYAAAQVIPEFKAQVDRLTAPAADSPAMGE